METRPQVPEEIAVRERASALASELIGQLAASRFSEFVFEKDGYCLRVTPNGDELKQVTVSQT